MGLRAASSRSAANETMARTLWPGQDPVGRIANIDVERTVVGVAGDVHHLTLERGAGSEFYLPIRQTQDYGSVDLVVRTNLPPRELAVRVREALRPIEPNLPTSGLRTLQELVDKAASPRRFVVVLLGGFAAFALILASLGIYAVISYSVSQRAGNRHPHGAGRIAGHRATRLAIVGVALGIFGAVVLTRLVASLLFGVTPTDPLTFGAVVAVLTAVAALAGYLPAARAARIEPMSALRAS